MTRDYTMKDFRAEMRRRGVTADAPPRPRGRHRTQRAQTIKKPLLEQPTVLAARDRVHGNTIARIVPCAIHPLHLVKIRGNGARSGCPMCEMQIEDLCRSFSDVPAKDPRLPRGPGDHSPRITTDPHPRINGCSCGWRTPPGAPDSEEAYVEHATVRR